MTRTIIDGLLRPEAFDHPVETLELVETHISWVILTGRFAYKIKKPLRFAFADFSTLERRQFCCTEEIRLNRRLAAELYVGVVSINETEDGPRIEGDGPVVEYAVKMRQFSGASELDRVLDRGWLTAAHVAELGRSVAAFHGRVPTASPQSSFGTAEIIGRRVAENFPQIASLMRDAPGLAILDEVRRWMEDTHRTLAPVFEERRRRGFVRECHGDMHLANMFLSDGRVVIFDGIDFNEELRWIDVVSEIAFVVMDLDRRSRPDLAVHFLNSYLEHSGDYEGLVVLPYYAAYRALVRAKVDAIARSEAFLRGDENPEHHVRCLSLLRLARSYSCPRRAALTITHGLSGAGKSTYANAISSQTRAIRVSSDVVRKRLHALGPADSSGSGVATGIYSDEATESTYVELERLAATVIDAGFPVVIDATFLRRAHRDRFRVLAENRAVPFRILRFDAPLDVLRARLAERHAGSVSEADNEVLEFQSRVIEALDDDETAFVEDVKPEEVNARTLDPNALPCYR